MKIRRYICYIPLSNNTLIMALSKDTSVPVFSKQELFQKFFYINKKDIRPVINRIISENRKNLTLEMAKRKKLIRPNEYRKFCEEMSLL
jgi:hypothetical protein